MLLSTTVSTLVSRCARSQTVVVAVQGPELQTVVVEITMPP